MAFEQITYEMERHYSNLKKCKYKDINQNNLENKQTQKIHVRDSETQTMDERTV